MKIALLTSLFKPEPVVGAQTAHSITRELSARGHQVVVITSFPSRPAGKLYPGFRRRLYQKEQDPAGFEVVRCFSILSSTSSMLSRFAENISFGVCAGLYLLFLPGVDLVYANVWYIFAAGLISLLARLRRIPYVVRVPDLYPESLVSQRRLLENSLVYRLMHGVDRWIAQGAAYVLVLTKFFARTYIEDRKVDPRRVVIIPDWVEGDLDQVDKEKSTAVREKFGIAETAFLAAYGGNIGVAAGVEALIAASPLVPEVHFLIAGDGSELSACQALARRVAPNTVSFFAPWPKEQTMPLYQAADVLVLPTRGAQSIASIPSKLIRYMLSGRCVIAASLPGTELENVIKESQCGWVISPDDPQALAQALIDAKKLSREERERRGMAGREYALKNLTEKKNLPQIIAILEGIPKDLSSKNWKRQQAG